MPTKLRYDQIKEFIDGSENGDELLSTEYKNVHTKLVFKCKKCDNIYSMSFWNYKYNHRCPKCAIKYKSSKSIIKYEIVKQYVENEGYLLITEKKDYTKASNKIKVTCKKHDPYYVKFTSFKYGGRCRKCYEEIIGEHNKHSYEYIKNFIEEEKYKLLSTTYKNQKQILNIQCSQGHNFRMRWNNFRSGQRCPRCVQVEQRSNVEKDIYDYIKTFYEGPIEYSNRSIIKNIFTNRWLELDIYLPELNMAIECNSYWHKNENAILKDKLKEKICIEKGILLYIIWYDDWLKNKKNVYDEIRKIITKLS